MRKLLTTDELINVVLSLEDKLRSKGIIFVNIGPCMRSYEIVTFASKYKHCNGVRGYIIVHPDRDIVCLRVGGGTTNPNMEATSDVMELVNNIGLFIGTSDYIRRNKNEH